MTAALALILAVSSTSWAFAPTSPATVTICITKASVARSAMTNGKCPKGTRSVVINRAGPRGQAGPTGPAGAQGAPGATGANGAATVVTGEPGVVKLGGALAIARARLSQAASEPVAIVFAGSSTTEGTGASSPAAGYANQLNGFLQQAYPSDEPETPMQWSQSANFSKVMNPGVHTYNAAEGGTVAGNYLTDAESTKVASLNPAVIFHMVGANDWLRGEPISVYRADLLARLDNLDQQIAAPHLHVLVQSYRMLRSPAVAGGPSWDEYGEVLEDIAAARPNVAVIDYAAAFAAVGVPGSDPLDLIGSDNTHATDAGHRLIAYSIRDALGLPVAR